MKWRLMPILSPNHPLDQAEKLISATVAGPPRQVDLRRAISASYYALFHLILTALADEFVGVSQRGTIRYGLVHRSVDHRAIKDLCTVISKATPPSRYSSYIPTGGFGQNILVFADSFIDLQERRHRADYDVTARYGRLDARVAIATGRSGMGRFRISDSAERRMLLTLLLCPPR